MIRPSAYSSPRGVKRWCLALLLCLLAPLSSAAQEPDCDDPPPANLPPPAGGPFTCPNGMSLPCDLELGYSIAGGRYVSDYLRLGDAIGTLDAGGTPAAEVPRFSFDAAGNRFYGKLYTKIRNAGSVPALVTSPVTVALDFNATSDPLDVDGPWTSAGSYTMNIPAGVAPAGALNGGLGTPGDPNPHIQLKPVCWHGPTAGELPRRFMLRARVDWGGSPPPTESSTLNNVAYKFYDLAPPKPVSDIGFVIDLSGSMLGVLPSGATKLAEAKDRARLFIDLIDDGERLGVYGFATGNPANGSFPASYRDASGASIGGTYSDTSVISAPAALTAATREPIRDAITAQGAHGCTPVGQGLLRARAGFATGSEHSKAIVLFSDGLQNVPPFVNSAATWSCGSASSMPPIDAAKTFAAEDTSIFSIYFGPEVLWSGYALMQQLRAQTGGDYVYGAATWLELASAYLAIRDQLDDLLYLDEHGQTAGPGPGAPFTVHFDTAVRRATVGIAWPLAQKAALTVEGRRQGESTWRRFDGPATPTAAGTTVDAGSGDDAHRVLRFDPGAGTTWELRVVQLAPRQGGGVPYVLGVYSDVESARLNVTLGSAGFIAGNPLPIFADLRRSGHAIVGAQVEADVLVPARAPSTAVRGYAGRLNATGTGDAGRVSAVAAQVRQLLAADGEPDLYSYRSVSVSLRDDGAGSDVHAGDGIYTGVLAGGDTQAAGEVQVTVRARGTTPSGFPFERAAKLVTIAAVGPADPERSEVRIDVGQVRPDGTRLATVTVLPSDRFGNAAFPGTGSTITVRPRAGGGTLAGVLEDNQDTTFVHTLVLGPGESPAVDVSVGGVAIGGAGTTKPPASFYRREASFHLGIAEPHGRFADVVDGGPSVALDFTYRFDLSLALRLEAGLSDFERIAGGGDRRLTHLVSYLQYRRAAGAWTPYFEAGPGLYDLEGGGSASGFAAGVGAYRALRPRWTLDLALHSHRVGGSLDLGFSQLRLGLLYSY